MKIIKNGDDKEISPFTIEEFHHTEKGEKEFHFETFPKTELSVQDKLGMSHQAEPKSAADGSRIFSSYGEEIVPSATPTVSEYNYDSFNEEHTAEEKYDPDFASPHSAAAEESAKEIEELKQHIEALTSENAELKQGMDSLRNEMQTAVENAKNTSFQEGYNKASAEHSEKDKVQYQAEQADYLAKVEESLKGVNDEIGKIKDILDTVDHQMPEIVLSYVKQLIGEERALNDKFIINVVNAAMDKLKDLQNVVLTVNPADAAALSGKYPNFGVNIDPNIPKGNVKVRTKVGELDLSVDSWLKELENKIDEQFKNTKVNPNG